MSYNSSFHSQDMCLKPEEASSAEDANGWDVDTNLETELDVCSCKYSCRNFFSFIKLNIQVQYIHTTLMHVSCTVRNITSVSDMARMQVKRLQHDDNLFVGKNYS